MAPYKTLINRTGQSLDVTLIVRRGDHPSETAGTVKVHLPPGPDDDGMLPEERSVQTVTYGGAIDIYLHGLELRLSSDGQETSHRRVIAERGKPLDNALNMYDTLEFRYDGKEILFTSSNADERVGSWH